MREFTLFRVSLLREFTVLGKLMGSKRTSMPSGVKKENFILLMREFTLFRGLAIAGVHCT